MKYYRPSRFELWLTAPSPAPGRRICPTCGGELTLEKGPKGVTRDHMRARSRGGRDFGNIIGICYNCNQLKGSMPYQTFLRLMRGELA